MTRSSAKADDPAAAQFPIFSSEEYDFSFKRQQWPVGLKSTFPEELIRRIGAAVTSYQGGNTAIDYTYKRYFKDKLYSMDDGSRLDLRIGRDIKSRMRLLSELVFQVTSLEPKTEGHLISEWTFLRIPFSVNFLLSCANRGALFEGAAIARMILEQAAWARAVDSLEDFETVRRTSATKSIGRLKEEFTNVGRLYGWLSANAHWAYEGHIRAYHIEDGRTYALLATTRFKACTLALTALVSVLMIKVFASMKAADIARLFDHRDTSESERKWSIREGELVPSLTELKSLSNLRSISNLTKELAAHYPDDSDINDISTMVSGECTEDNDHG